MERKIGYMLPKNAGRPQWWTGATELAVATVQHRAWGEAGFEACLIPGTERVRFRRVAAVGVTT